MSPEPPLHKADFGTIYDRPDPRAYYATLEPLDYAHPAARLRRRGAAAGGARSARPGDPDGPRRLLLLRRAGDAAQDGPGPRQAHRALHVARTTSGLTVEELRDADRAVLQTHRHPRAPRVVGLDVAAHAVGYAVSTGALEEGAVENLEADSPSDALADAAARGRPGHHHRWRRLRHRGDVRRAGRLGPGLDLVRDLLPADLRLHAGRRRLLHADGLRTEHRAADRPAATLHRRRDEQRARRWPRRRRSGSTPPARRRPAPSTPSCTCRDPRPTPTPSAR